jgi:hypothetical protein
MTKVLILPRGEGRRLPLPGGFSWGRVVPDDAFIAAVVMNPDDSAFGCARRELDEEMKLP